MKVLLLNGSPHEKGCTYTALEEIARTLHEEGVESEIFQLGSAPIRGCAACGGCSKTEGTCVFDDDAVNRFLAAMKAADGLIVGSPVYYASPNGAVLSLLDRAFYAGECFAYKPAAAVVSARRAGTTASLEVLQKYFQLSHMPIVSSQYWPMVHGNTPEQVKEDLEGLQIMRTLAHNMVWLLKCIEAGKAAGIEPGMKEKRVATNFIR